MAKFAGYIGIDLALIYRMNDFLVRFLVFELLSILYFAVINRNCDLDVAKKQRWLAWLCEIFR